MENEPSERFKAACDMIGNRGISVMKACLEIGWNTGDFYEEISKNKDAEAVYLRSRERRSHARFERMDETVEKVMSGAINPNAGRVVLDAVRWMMAKEKPLVYGEKTINDVNVQVTLSNLVEQSIAPAVPAIAAPDVIDVTPIPDAPKLNDFI